MATTVLTETARLVSILFIWLIPNILIWILCLSIVVAFSIAVVIICYLIISQSFAFSNRKAEAWGAIAGMMSLFASLMSLFGVAEDFGGEKVFSRGEERAYIDDPEDTVDDGQSVLSEGDDGPSFLERMDEHHAMNKGSLAVVRQRGQERVAGHYGGCHQGAVQ
ncbi:hypothetical protein LTR17_009346 [Elasticomyces elasticus]|nr:hypothetical protein LTR17_009346 [Elasticomyces elasticus]